MIRSYQVQLYQHGLAVCGCTVQAQSPSSAVEEAEKQGLLSVTGEFVAIVTTDSHRLSFRFQVLLQ